MSFEVLGVTVSKPLPVGLQHVRLQPGLNLLYGKNGTGKTRILEAVSQTLGNAKRIDLSDEDEAFNDPFLAGGIHISKIWDGQDHRTDHWFTSKRNWQEVNQDEKWDQWIFDLLDARPWIYRDRAEVRQLRVSGSFHQAASLGLAEEHWRWLVDQGRWLVHPARRTMWLCDPSPYESPLKELWAKSGRRWRDVGFSPEGDRTFLARSLRQAEARWPTWNERPTPSAVVAPWYQNEYLLPLLPEMSGLEPAPSWVGYPVLRTDIIPLWIPAVDSVWQGSDEGPGKVTWDPVTDILIDHFSFLEERLNRNESEDSKKLEYLRIEATRIEQNTNQMMKSVFEAPPIIRIDTRLTVGYSRRPPIAVEACFEQGSGWFPVSELGDAHRRFVTMFIRAEVLRFQGWNPVKDQQWKDMGIEPSKRSIPEGRKDVILQSPTIAIIDEPERGLHARAEVKMSSGIDAIADRVLIATHSVRFLDEGFKHGMPHLVTRNEIGLPEIRGGFSHLSETSQSHLQEELGVGLGELALLTSVFVLVEGVHDQVLIEHFLQGEFREQRIQVVPMQGTKGVEDLITSPFIFVATSAPIVICLDNGRQKHVEDLLGALRNANTLTDQINLITRNIRNFETMEMKAVLGLLRQAVDRNQLWRVHPFLFSRRDILEYIPISYLTKRFNSWKELDKEFLNTHGSKSFQPGDGRRKKDWMAKLGIKALENDLRRVVKEMAANGENRPKEFGDLAELILRASRARPSS